MVTNAYTLPRLSEEERKAFDEKLCHPEKVVFVLDVVLK
jgi:hypothetical protein